MANPIQLAIARLKITVLNGAMITYVGRHLVSKTEAVNTLLDMVQAGNLSLAMIESCGEVPLQSATSDPALVQAVGVVASRAEAVALDALKLGMEIQEGSNDLKAMVKDLVDEVLTISKRTPPALDTASVQTQVTKAIADAFKPFAEAVQATGAQAVVAAMTAVHVIDRKPALDVFGIDVRDMKGNPLMINLYNAPNAPAIDPDFVWSPSILTHFVISQEYGENAFMAGDKGTGKSVSAEQWAARTGRPFVRYNFNKMTTADDYAGAQALEQGSSVFKRGDFLQAYISPATVILLDELSFATAGNLAPMNGFLEGKSRISYGGTTHVKAEGVMIFGADNTFGNGDESGRYAGTNAMNSATLDRFGRIIHFTFMPIDLEIKAVVGRTGCDPKLAEHVLMAINVARSKAKDGDIVEAPSIRSVMSFIRALNYLSVAEAWKATIALRQPSESAPVLESIKLSCIDEKLISQLI